MLYRRREKHTKTSRYDKIRRKQEIRKRREIKYQDIYQDEDIEDKKDEQKKEIVIIPSRLDRLYANIMALYDYRSSYDVIHWGWSCQQKKEYSFADHVSVSPNYIDREFFKKEQYDLLKMLTFLDGLKGRLVYRKISELIKNLMSQIDLNEVTHLKQILANKENNVYTDLEYLTYFFDLSYNYIDKTPYKVFCSECHRLEIKYNPFTCGHMTRYCLDCLQGNGVYYDEYGPEWCDHWNLKIVLLPRPEYRKLLFPKQDINSASNVPHHISLKEYQDGCNYNQHIHDLQGNPTKSEIILARIRELRILQREALLNYDMIFKFDYPFDQYLYFRDSFMTKEYYYFICSKILMVTGFLDRCREWYWNDLNRIKAKRMAHWKD